MHLRTQFLEATSDLNNDAAQQPPCLHANLLFQDGDFGSIVVEVQACAPLLCACIQL